MFERMIQRKRWKAAWSRGAALLFRHRTIYAGLCLCHGSGCWITDKPELYGPIALLYGVLTLRS